MLKRALILWIIGLLTLVPYGTWYLFMEAPREQYALLITGILFWIFGFWGIAGPLIGLLRVRQVFRAIERMRSPEERRAWLKSPETRAAAVDYIAEEHGIPRFLAERVLQRLVDEVAGRLADRNAAPL